MVRTIDVGGRAIGPGCRPWVIAELSGNHNGDLDRAIAILRAIRDAGGEAVKLQTYTADTLTIDHAGPGFVVDDGLWAGRTLHDLYTEAHTPWEWHEPLFRAARDLGLVVFSTPFDTTAIDLLESLDAPLYKVASPEIVDLDLVAAVAATGKPMLLSTGMATLEEIGVAVETARDAGCRDLVLLYCVSGYPTPPEEMRLRTIPHLAETFDVVVGLSDHSHGVAMSVAAVALGASVIEKHVTLARADGGVDSEFSLEPDELAELVRATAATAAATAPGLGYELTDSERTSLVFRRSLYVVQDVAPGEVLTAANVRSIRPGFGLAPRHLPFVLGRVAARPLQRGEPLGWDGVGGPA